MADPTSNYKRPTRNMSEQDAIGGALADIAVALNRIADQWAVQNMLKLFEVQKTYQYPIQTDLWQTYMDRLKNLKV